MAGRASVEEVVHWREGEIEALWKTVEEQQRQINLLRSSHACMLETQTLQRETCTDLDNQHRALCDCLRKLGLLNCESPLGRWEEGRRRRRGLRKLLDEPRPVRGLLLCADVRAIASLATASRAVMGTVRCSLAGLQEERGELSGFWLSRGALDKQIVEMRRLLRLQESGWAPQAALVELSPRSGKERQPRASAWPELLEVLWLQSGFRDVLISAMGSNSVAEFRKASRSSCECMRDARRPSRTPRLTAFSSRRESLMKVSQWRRAEFGLERSSRSSSCSSYGRSTSVESRRSCQQTLAKTRRKTEYDVIDEPWLRCLCSGDVVKLHGLKARPELNGAQGRLLTYAVEIARWHVQLQGSEERVRMRSVNMTLMRLKTEEPPDRLLPSRGPSPPSLPACALPRVAGFCDVPARLSLAAVSSGAAEAVRHKGRVYVCGGTDGQRIWDSAECLDVESGRWSLLPPMNHKRTAAGKAVLGGRLFVFGGATDPSGLEANTLESLGAAESFDPRSGKWESLPRMIQPRVFPMVAILEERRIYVCGGCLSETMGSRSRSLKGLTLPSRQGSFEGWETMQSAKPYPLKSMERFSLRRRHWRKMRSMPKARYGAVVAVDGSRLVLAGGFGDSELNEVDVYIPQGERWSSVSSMPSRRAFASSASMFGYLYVVGGVISNRAVKSAERFSFAKNQWDRLPPMSFERCGACAHAVPAAGHIVVCGGVQGVRSASQSSALTIEAFSLHTGAWEVLAPMVRSRCYHSSAAVGSQLYVFGGCQGPGPNGQSPILFAGERIDLNKGLSSNLPGMQVPRLGAIAALLPR